MLFLAALSGCASAPQAATATSAPSGLHIGDEVTATVTGSGERVCGAIWEFDGAGNAQVVVEPHKASIATVRLSDARKGCEL